MLLDELFINEQVEDAAIIFGRFNPPHQGHVAAWKEAAKFPIWYVGTNQSTIGPKDPLPFDVKIKAMQTLFTEIKGHLVAEQSWFTLAAMVYKKHGAVTLHIVTDEADSATYVTMLTKQNGKEGKHGFYDFKDIVWQPAPRLSSATDLRAAVANNDRAAFTKAAGVPADTMVDGEKFFDLVKQYLDAQAKPVKKVAETIRKLPSGKFRLYSKKGDKNLGTFDSKKAAEKHEREVQYFKHMSEGFKNAYSVGDRVDGPMGTGTIVAVSKNINVDDRVKVKLDDPSKAGEDGAYKDTFVLTTSMLKHISESTNISEMGGVGVVANNPKQAKDPRYVMSMTNDVKPGETQRQARKMGFRLNSKGIPPSLR